MRALVFTTAMVILATPAGGETPTSAKPETGRASVPSTGPGGAKTPALEKLICRRETEMGSVIPKKVCRTPEQIEADVRGARAVDDDRARQGGRADTVPRR
jgi:hypothetical protein